MLLAQLTDTHLLGDPSASAWDHNPHENMVSVLRALPPRIDAMVVTGDVADDGSVPAYRLAQKLIAGRATQTHFIPGNHDDPQAMAAVFGARADVEMVPLSEHWTLGLLNSQWIGHDAGHVSDATLAGLREQLGGVDTSVVLCLHHPPVSPCAAPDCGLNDTDRLLDVLRDSPVRVVLSGHVHQQFETERDGVAYLGAPSTFRQLGHGDPHYADLGEPPACRVVELLDNGEFRSRPIVGDVKSG